MARSAVQPGGTPEGAFMSNIIKYLSMKYLALYLFPHLS